jgi:hypothetical protein
MSPAPARLNRSLQPVSGLLLRALDRSVMISRAALLLWILAAVLIAAVMAVSCLAGIDRAIRPERFWAGGSGVILAGTAAGFWMAGRLGLPTAWPTRVTAARGWERTACELGARVSSAVDVLTSTSAIRPGVPAAVLDFESLAVIQAWQEINRLPAVPHPPLARPVLATCCGSLAVVAVWASAIHGPADWRHALTRQLPPAVGGWAARPTAPGESESPSPTPAEYRLATTLAEAAAVERGLSHHLGGLLTRQAGLRTDQLSPAGRADLDRLSAVQDAVATAIDEALTSFSRPEENAVVASPKEADRQMMHLPADLRSVAASLRQNRLAMAVMASEAVARQLDNLATALAGTSLQRQPRPLPLETTESELRQAIVTLSEIDERVSAAADAVATTPQAAAMTPVPEEEDTSATGMGQAASAAASGEGFGASRSGPSPAAGSAGHHDPLWRLYPPPSRPVGRFADDLTMPAAYAAAFARYVRTVTQPPPSAAPQAEIAP